MRMKSNMTRQIKVDDFQGGSAQKCLMCGEGVATLSYQVQEFEYGAGPEAVTLHARVPVWSCSTCELEYVDADGERAQHAAVCRHLGRLTPTDIKGIRVAASLTQKQFADELKCGIASLKRWETGALIQGRSADAAIRAFQTSRKRTQRPAPSFRTPLTEAHYAAAKRFSLRGAQPMQHAA